MIIKKMVAVSLKGLIFLRPVFNLCVIYCARSAGGTFFSLFLFHHSTIMLVSYSFIPVGAPTRPFGCYFFLHAMHLQNAWTVYDKPYAQIDEFMIGLQYAQDSSQELIMLSQSRLRHKPRNPKLAIYVTTCINLIC